MLINLNGSEKKDVDSPAHPTELEKEEGQTMILGHRLVTTLFINGSNGNASEGQRIEDAYLWFSQGRLFYRHSESSVEKTRHPMDSDEVDRPEKPD